MTIYSAPIDDMMFLFEHLKDNKEYNEIEKKQRGYIGPSKKYIRRGCENKSGFNSTISKSW